MTFFIHIWAILCELAPWLLLGAVIAGILHVLVPNEFIKKHLGSKSWWSTIKAAFIGVPMPLCSCAVIPTGIGLKKDGASDGAAVSFLISTPQTGVDSITVAAGFLGWPFAIFKLCSAFIMGIIGGQLVHWLTNAQEKRSSDQEDAKPACCGGSEPAPVVSSCCSPEPEPELKPEPEPASCCGPAKPEPTPEAASCCGPTEPKGPNAFQRAFHFAVFDLLRMIWLWLFIGVLISAALSSFIEADSLSSYTWAGGISAMLIMLVISLPLYVCATASVPIAAALITAGLPTGAALVFLMAGPATNIATIGAIAKTFGKGITSIYLLTVIIGSVGLGLLFDAFFSLNQATGHMHAHHEYSTWWAVGSAILLIIFLLMFAAMDIKRYLNKRSSAQATKSCCH